MSTTITQTEIDALEKAIASGVTSVTHNGQKVDYADFASLTARRDYLKRLIAGVEDTRRKHASFSKGVTT